MNPRVGSRFFGLNGLGIPLVLLVAAAMYALTYWGAVHRLRHPAVKPKYHFLAEVLRIDVSQLPEGERGSAAKKGVAEAMAAADEYKEFGFRGADAKSKRSEFVSAAERLAAEPAGTYAYQQHLTTLLTVAESWGRLTPYGDGGWLDSFPLYQSGAGFGVPVGTTDNIRRDAGLYLAHRDAFDSLEVGGHNLMIRMTPREVVRAPWRLLRFYDPNRYELSQYTTLAVAMLMLSALFFRRLEAGCIRSGVAVWKVDRRPKWPSRLRRPFKGESQPARVWRIVGVVSAVILAFFEGPETWPEWLPTLVVLVVGAWLIPDLLMRVATLARSDFSDDFYNLESEEQNKRLRPLLLGAVAIVASTAWVASYSFVSLVLSLDLPRFARGLLQLALCCLVLYWVLQLLGHVAGLNKAKRPIASSGAADAGSASVNVAPGQHLGDTALTELTVAAALVLIPSAAFLGDVF